jgi:hypothetical protein
MRILLVSDTVSGYNFEVIINDLIDCDRGRGYMYAVIYFISAKTHLPEIR